MKTPRIVFFCVAMAALPVAMGACSRESTTGEDETAAELRDRMSMVEGDSGAVAEPAGQSGTPDIEFEALDYDFGEADQGDTVEHVFKFKNAGDADLVIERVGSS